MVVSQMATDGVVDPRRRQPLKIEIEQRLAGGLRHREIGAELPEPVGRYPLILLSWGAWQIPDLGEAVSFQSAI